MIRPSYPACRRLIAVWPPAWPAPAMMVVDIVLRTGFRLHARPAILTESRLHGCRATGRLRQFRTGRRAEPRTIGRRGGEGSNASSPSGEWPTCSGRMGSLEFETEAQDVAIRRTPDLKHLPCPSLGVVRRSVREAGDSSTQAPDRPEPCTLSADEGRGRRHPSGDGSSRQDPYRRKRCATKHLPLHGSANASTESASGRTRLGPRGRRHGHEPVHAGTDRGRIR